MGLEGSMLQLFAAGQWNGRRNPTAERQDSDPQQGIGFAGVKMFLCIAGGRLELGPCFGHEHAFVRWSFMKVIDYCKYHKDNPPEEIQKPLKSTNLVECGVSEWDSEYVNIEQEAPPCGAMSPHVASCWRQPCRRHLAI